MKLAEQLQQNFEEQTSIENLAKLAEEQMLRWVKDAYRRNVINGIVCFDPKLHKSLSDEKRLQLQAITIALLHREGFDTEIDRDGDVKFWVEADEPTEEDGE